MLLKFFKDIEREWTLPNSFCEARFMLTPKHNKDVKEKGIIDQYL
jgi:hypothetical protein